MTKFSDLGLSPEVLRAVVETGYDTPTAIQEQAIPIALTGLDVLGIAQTGTGKTAAFTLPMIERLAAGRSKARMPRAIVLAPTRELADQVSEAFEKYAKYHKLNWALLIGGVSMADQVSKLDKGVDVLIATPGRLLDLFERSKVMLNGVQIMVVDEADRMLDMGFIPDIERIFKLTPPTRQTLFFSATMPPEITRLTQQFLKNPVRIEVSRPASTNENIAQFILRVPSKDSKAKRIALRTLIKQQEVESGIVFCNKKSDVDIVAKSLNVHGFDAAPIHGDLDQSLRMKTLDSFRQGKLKLLVASDVAARGLDIPDVSHVFNFDVPHHADDYVHRIGRTGRAGRKGEAYLLLSPMDEKNYEKILSLIKKEPQSYELEVDYSQMDLAGSPPKAKTGSKTTKDKVHKGSQTKPRQGRDHKPIPNSPTDENNASMQAIEFSTELKKIESPPPHPTPSDKKKTQTVNTKAAKKSSTAEVATPNQTHKAPKRQDSFEKTQSSKSEDIGFGDHLPAFMRNN